MNVGDPANTVKKSVALSTQTVTVALRSVKQSHHTGVLMHAWFVYRLAKSYMINSHSVFCLRHALSHRR